MARRTPTPTPAQATRCPVTEGAQQCLKATHSRVKGHTWGPRGETSEWHADGTPKNTDPSLVELAAEHHRRAAAEIARMQAGQLQAEAATIAIRRPDAITLTLDADQQLDRVDDHAGLAILAHENAATLVNLSAGNFEHEAAAVEALIVRLDEELYARDRLLVFAAAAAGKGHHPGSAYLFAADRHDPIGVGA